MGLFNLTNTFASQSGNVPASQLDTNFQQLAIMSQYATAASVGTNTVTITAPLTFGAYALGMRFAFTAGSSNTGATTLNVNSIGGVAVQKNGLALQPGDIAANGFYEVYYDGSNFQLQNPTATEYLLQVNALAGSATSAFTSKLSSTFKKYRVTITDLQVSGSPVNLLAQVGVAGSYKSAAGDYCWANARNTAVPAGNDDGIAADTSLHIADNASSGTSGGGAGVTRTVNGDVIIYNPAGSFIKSLTWNVQFINSSGTFNSVYGGGAYLSGGTGAPAAAVDSLQFLLSAGTMTGNMYLYGVRGS